MATIPPPLSHIHLFSSSPPCSIPLPHTYSHCDLHLFIKYRTSRPQNTRKYCHTYVLLSTRFHVNFSFRANQSKINASLCPIDMSFSTWYVLVRCDSFYSIPTALNYPYVRNFVVLAKKKKVQCYFRQTVNHQTIRDQTGEDISLSKCC